MSYRPQSIYDLIGAESIHSLADAFYDAVDKDPVLRPMYPDDLSQSRRFLRMFLVQFFGGPSEYSAERGHPRLRMRHFPFAIDQQARDHWLQHMWAAIDSVGIAEPARSQMRDYFERSSEFLINRRDQA
ncbi:MAG: globin [Chloroflexi bacterium]|nr:globin [Chloroflexota bacterium]